MSLTKVTYSMINGAPLNVLDYGADNTGTVDSTAQIQAAVNDAGALGRVLEFAPGNYLKSDDIVLPISLKMFCARTAAITNTVSGKKGFTTNATGSTRHFISAEGIIVQCSGTNTGTVGWDLANNYGGVFDRVGCASDNGVDGFLVGMKFEATSTGVAWYNNIYNPFIRTRTDASAIGLHGLGSGGNGFNSNIVMGGQIVADNGTGALILGDNNKFVGVSFESSAAWGVDVVNNNLCKGNAIIGCRFEGCTSGIRFGSDANGNSAYCNYYTVGVSPFVQDVNNRNMVIEPLSFSVAVNRGRFEAIEAVDSTKGLFLANCGTSGDICFDARAVGNTHPVWQVRRNGSVEWGSGTASPDVSLRRLSSGTISFVSGGLTTLPLSDGVSAPTPASGKAILYVDSADGDLKIAFGDGTVKTIVTDTP